MSAAAGTVPVAHEPLVRFTGLEKRYKGRFLLRVEQLTLRRGDHLLLVGANGSGKSTFLRILAGALPADSRQLWRHRDWSRLRIAYVPQSGGLYGELTVADNLAIRRSYYRWWRRGKHSHDLSGIGHSHSSTTRLGIDAVLRTPARALSGGLHRLVSLAAALQSDPDVLIIDEPFGDLDERGVEAVKEVLDEVLPRLELFVAAMPMEGPSLPVHGRLQITHGTLAAERPGSS